MIVKSVNPTSYSGMYKFIPLQGESFFIRKDYLSSLNFDLLQKDFELTEEQQNEILDSALACVVELKAVEYLARCEQCRFGLTQKLIKKQFEPKYIQMALDYLESVNYLSDKRFATAWINTRKINHYEGRTRLLSELLSRGISKEIATECIDEFFTENKEEEICNLAYQKFIKKGKTGDKLVQSMFTAGFTFKQIKIAQENLQN